MYYRIRIFLETKSDIKLSQLNLFEKEKKIFNLKINIYNFSILKTIYPTINWPLSPIPIQARVIRLVTQLMESGQRI